MKNSTDSQTTVLVWDAEGLPPAGEWTTILWRNYGDGIMPNTISIPTLVELHAKELRRRYLAWIYELGERRVQGRCIVDHLELRPGFSYWWMTLLAEKCNYSKSPQITDAIRLMAFEKLASDRSYERIVLASANKSLADCIRPWCKELGVSFEWQPTMDDVEKSFWIKRFYQTLPHSVQAIIWFIHNLFNRWPLVYIHMLIHSLKTSIPY